MNHGLIQVVGTYPLAYAVDMIFATPGTVASLTNFGTISAAGGTAIVGVNNGVDRIANFGIINGDVAEQGGSDFFRNGGHVVGDVDLGAGNDLFKGWDGTVEGTIHGRGGNDTIGGGISDDLIFGDAGNDMLKGNGGDDTLVGGVGHDFLTGGQGNDTFAFNSPVELFCRRAARPHH